ncbi:MAG: ferritin family protein [Thermodesulfobacteriota bacterium]
MSFAFSADEIFKLAERIEKNGAEFYRRAAEAASCGNARKLFVELAAMEDAHQQIFADLRKELPDKEKVSDTFDPEGEAGLYLASLANSRVFTDPESPIAGPVSSCSDALLKDIYKFALTREKDSIAFYLGMKDLVATETGKCKVDDIIREEMHHVRVLSEALSKLS